MRTMNSLWPGSYFSSIISLSALICAIFSSISIAQTKVVIIPDGLGTAPCPKIPAGCPATHRQRTPTTVFNDLQSSINAQNWTDVACNYADDAFVIGDQGIQVGHSDIVTAQQSLSDTFSGVSPTLGQLDVFKNLVRVLDNLDAGWITMPDRVRSLVVECGLITQQAEHGLIVFTGPPPPD